MDDVFEIKSMDRYIKKDGSIDQDGHIDNAYISVIADCSNDFYNEFKRATIDDKRLEFIDIIENQSIKHFRGRLKDIEDLTSYIIYKLNCFFTTESHPIQLDDDITIPKLSLGIEMNKFKEALNLFRHKYQKPEEQPWETYLRKRGELFDRKNDEESLRTGEIRSNMVEALYIDAEKALLLINANSSFWKLLFRTIEYINKLRVRDGSTLFFRFYSECDIGIESNRFAEYEYDRLSDKGGRACIETTVKDLKELIRSEIYLEIKNIEWQRFAKTIDGKLPVEKKDVCRISCRFKEECPSYSGWCELPKNNFSRCIPFLLTAIQIRDAKIKRLEKQIIQQALHAESPSPIMKGVIEHVNEEQMDQNNTGKNS